MLADSDLWMDGLHLRLHKRSDEITFDAIEGMLSAANSHVWMSNTTMQGDGDGISDCVICGLQSLQGSLHIEGAHAKPAERNSRLHENRKTCCEAAPGQFDCE